MVPTSTRRRSPAPTATSADDDEKAPWHFKLMVVALVVYLVYRFGSMFFG